MEKVLSNLEDMLKIRSIFLLIIVYFVLFSRTIYATEISTNSATPSRDVNYFLAYPGILPDNPFYFLKAFRDKAVSTLINDNRKRAEFNLLTSDKRMFAGQILIEKDDRDRGIITISKSNNYFHNAISAAQSAQKDGTQMKDVYDKMLLSMQKHIEIMHRYEQYFKGEEKDFYTFERGRMNDMTKMVQKEINKIEKK